MIINGDLTVPGDKSLTHRALMFAAVGRGTSRLRGLLTGEDCRSTAAVLRALGASIPELPRDGGELVVQSEGIGSWRQPTSILDCGNSGTTARLMMGLLAGRPFCATLTGDQSLRSRPMRRITDPLSTMGIRVNELERPDRLPLEICGGALSTLDYRSPKSSAQIKSAILFAGLSGRVPVSVIEPGLSRDHTERMLKALGVDIEEGEVEGGWRVATRPPAGDLSGLDMQVPGDPSSAAFLIALALLANEGELRIRDVGVNPTRIGFIEAVRRMGGSVSIEGEGLSGGEANASIIVSASRLRATEVGAEEMPTLIDEVPMIACLAARAEGDTRITGADELRAKESDRIKVVVDNLRAIGADAEELADGMVIRGSDRPLVGRIAAHHDHRIAMAFGVLAALPGNRIEVDTPDVVDVSFPGFWDTLRRLGGTLDTL